MPSSPQADFGALVHAARRGDQLAWTRLHQEFNSMLRTVAGSCRLPDHDVDDAVQNTWIKLHRHINGIREPSAVARWLATTARRESLRLLQSHVREILTDNPTSNDEGHEDRPEVRLLERERHVVLTRALATLPDRHRRLMTLIAGDAGYEQIETTLGIPMGSIGPIRSRCLARLQRHPELRELAETG
jgi:RNA polymerase sigma factor (sigma-70 family)